MDEEAAERVELPPELYYIILAFAGRPLLSRLLSQPLSAYGSQQLDHLTIVTAGRDHQVPMAWLTGLLPMPRCTAAWPALLHVLSALPARSPCRLLAASLRSPCTALHGIT